MPGGIRPILIAICLLAAGLLPGTMPAASAAIQRPTTAPPAACRYESLVASHAWQGATGALVGHITVTNTGPITCLLVNPPHVQLLSNLKPVPVTVRTDWNATEGAAVHQIDLAPGASVHALIQWSNWCGGELYTPLVILIRLPGREPPLVASRGAPPAPHVAGTPKCDQAKLPSTLLLGPFDPVNLVDDPAALAVRLYYGGIDRHAWPAAWQYLAPIGRPAYRAWVAGYRGTTSVTLDRLVVPAYRIRHGGADYTCAGIEFASRQASGARIAYGGWYLVRITRVAAGEIGAIVLPGSRVTPGSQALVLSRSGCAARFRDARVSARLISLYHSPGTTTR
jgi:hypothetical protein